MANYQDILSSALGAAGHADFIVNNAVAEVAITAPDAAGLVFNNANGNSWFAAGDNVLLQGAWINIPYGFGQGSGQAVMGIAWKDSLGNAVIIPELGGNSVLTLPNYCGPLEFPPGGLFITTPKTLGKVQLVLTNLTGFTASQINVPALLPNGAVIQCQFHLQALHTLALAGVP